MRNFPVFLSCLCLLLSACTPAVVIHPEGEARVYLREFADSLSIAQQDNHGRPLANTYVYFAELDAASPDGHWELRWKTERSKHSLILLDRKLGSSSVVLKAEEGDVGSGRAHHYRWSHDSKAVFIYGWMKPEGALKKEDWALVYLTELRTLHECVLNPLIQERLPATAQRGQPSVFGKLISIRNSILARPAWLKR